MAAALRYRGLQNAVVVLVSALLAGAASFGPWYHRLVENSAVRQAFEEGTPGSTWSLTAPGEADLSALLPARGPELFAAPVTGRSAQLTWQSPPFVSPVQGGLVSRDDACAHLELVAGDCPDRAGEVAVSEADAELYALRPGVVVPEVSIRYDGADLTVTGVYRLADPADPFWFGTLPTGRSGFQDDVPFADQFVTVPETFTAQPARSFLSRADLRVVPTRVTVAELPVLAAATRELRERTRGQGDLLTTMPAALERLDESRQVARTSLVLMGAQVAVLALAVLTMLVGLVLLSRRTETGLGRLRGQSVRRLVGRTTLEWLVVVLAGTVLGVGLGWLAALAARAAWVSRSSPLGLPGGVPVVVAGTVLVSLALMAIRSRQVAGEPIPALLRSTQPRAAVAGGRQVAADAALVTAALAGLAVGLQSPEDSALVLLAPSLLAVAASVLLARLLARAGATLARRSLARGRTARTLAAIQLARPRGLPALLTVLCVATAFAVFSTQVATVAERIRSQRAEVESGAAAVLGTRAPLADVVRALDAVDPDRTLATPVVRTRVDEQDFVSLMLVEPGPFQRIAYGAARVASPAGWAGTRAPRSEPLVFTGSRLTGSVAATLTGTDVPPSVDLLLDYRDSRGERATALLADLGARTATRISVPVHCAEGCELIRWRLLPAGGASGTVALTGLAVDGQSLDLAGVDWVPVLGSDDYELEPASATGRLDLRFSTRGLSLAVQHPWVPVRARALLSREHAASARSESATVPLPGGVDLPLRITATARDAVPGVLRNVAVSDLENALRLAETATTDDMLVQLWLSEAGAAGRERLAGELAGHGVRVQPVGSVTDARQRYEEAPEALAEAVAPAAGTLALLLALLGLVLAASAGWRARSHDLAALRLAGVPRRTLLAATYSSQLVLVLAAALAGTACGLVGAALALARLPIFADPEPAIALDPGLAPVPAVVVALGAAGVLGAAAALSAHWLVGRAEPARTQERDG